MELAPKRYYTQSKFPNTYYVTLMALERYFGTNLFKGQASRVFYASNEYMLRRRLDMLNKNAEQTIHSLDFPFMSYFRNGNWEIDTTRSGNPDPLTAYFGITEENNPPPIKAMLASAKFNAWAIFARDDEAQIAHETLLWMKHPARKQFIAPGLNYKNYKLDLPVQLAIDEVQFNPEVKETDWLKKNRVFVLNFGFIIQSFIISPIAQGTTSNLFETEEDPSNAFYITKEAYLDYFSSKDLPFPDEVYYTDVVTGEFSNDPSLNATFVSSDITNTSVTLSWDFNEASEEFYEETIKITSNTGIDLDISRDLKTTTISGLQPASTYNFTIWFYAKTGYINKYNLIVTTASQNYQPLTLKPL